MPTITYEDPIGAWVLEYKEYQVADDTFLVIIPDKGIKQIFKATYDDFILLRDKGPLALINKLIPNQESHSTIPWDYPGTYENNTGQSE